MNILISAPTRSGRKHMFLSETVENRPVRGITIPPFVRDLE